MTEIEKNTREICLDKMEELMPLIRERLASGQSVKFSPSGISMLPMIRQGRDEVILSSPPSRLKKYDIPLYQRENGKYILHRVVRVGETYTCIGDNQFVFEEGVSHESVIAVVSAFVRDGKMKSVNSLSYWLYCRMWHYSRYPRRKMRGLKNRISALLRKR